MSLFCVSTVEFSEILISVEFLSLSFKSVCSCIQSDSLLFLLWGIFHETVFNPCSLLPGLVLGDLFLVLYVVIFVLFMFLTNIII